MSFSRQGVLILLEDLRQALNLNKIKQALKKINTLPATSNGFIRIFENDEPLKANRYELKSSF